MKENGLDTIGLAGSALELGRLVTGWLQFAFFVMRFWVKGGTKGLEILVQKKASPVSSLKTSAHISDTKMVFLWFSALGCSYS